MMESLGDCHDAGSNHTVRHSTETREFLLRPTGNCSMAPATLFFSLSLSLSLCLSFFSRLNLAESGPATPNQYAKDTDVAQTWKRITFHE